VRRNEPQWEKLKLANDMAKVEVLKEEKKELQ
jgi:hypothetical protein